MLYQQANFGLSVQFDKLKRNISYFPRHIHRSFELVLCLKGRMEVLAGAREYRLAAGDAVLIFPDQPHEFSDTESENLLFIFSPDTVGAYYEPLKGKRPVNSLMRLPEWLFSELLALEGEDSLVKRKAVLYAVCAALDAATEYTESAPAEHLLLSRVFDYVESRFAEDCSLAAVSREVGCSAAYLSRFFKQATDMPFVLFVNQCRISHACHLLRSTDKSILTCSMDCGYATLRSFNRNFKSLLGASPKEYRERFQKK